MSVVTWKVKGLVTTSVYLDTYRFGLELAKYYENHTFWVINTVLYLYATDLILHIVDVEYKQDLPSQIALMLNP